MKKLHMKLFLSLVVFAIIIVTVVTFTNRKLIQSEIKERTLNSWAFIDHQVLENLKTIDNVQYYLERQLTKDIEKELRNMVALYKENQDVMTWNLEEMKKTHGMEIFILDELNTVVRTTYKIDEGINFNDCCTNFARVLDQRRMSGEFFSDALDGSTMRGEVWKYSYLATPDHRYLFEIGVPVTNIPQLDKFDFFDKTTRIANKYDDLLDIKIYNKSGFHLTTKTTSSSIEQEDEQMQQAFQRALETSETVQFTRKVGNGLVETYRYMPYNTLQNKGYSTQRVVFTKYNNATEQALLKKNIHQFYFVLTITLFISFMALLVINWILKTTIKQAESDPLTGIYNRATYLERMNQLLKRKQNKKVGLLLFDVDYFKQVNDQFGHIKGDFVLIEIAEMLAQIAKKKGFAVRFGGDEFVIVLEEATTHLLEQMAQEALKQVQAKKLTDDEAWQIISLSIGGTVQKEARESQEALYLRADEALYQAKYNGKNQYNL